MIAREYITGATGFIGRKLLEKTGSLAIPHLDIPTYRFGDFTRFYYLASYGNLASQNDVEETIRANLIDPVNVAIRTLDTNYKSFVWFSTSSVTLPRQTVYSRAKKATEQILLSLIEGRNKPIVIIRPYSVTGVGEQKEHLIPKLIRSCLDGEPMNIVLEPTHDFIDVDDVVSGTINISQNGGRGIFELGTGRMYSNRQVLEIVEDITGKKANVTVVPKIRDYDTTNWVCQNFRARKWGWLPQKSLEVSIKEMVDEYTREKAN